MRCSVPQPPRATSRQRQEGRSSGRWKMRRCGSSKKAEVWVQDRETRQKLWEMRQKIWHCKTGRWKASCSAATCMPAP